MRLLLKKPSLDPTNPVNYCPVSDVSFLVKVAERLIVEELQIFLDDSSLLDPFQSIFHLYCGIEMELVPLTDDLWRYLGLKDRLALLLLLDLIAAFSTVSYDLMTHCLSIVETRNSLTVVHLFFPCLRTEDGAWGKSLATSPSTRDTFPPYVI